jgi:hypothetical protein
MKNVFAPASVTREMLRRFSCSETTLTILDAAAGLGWKELEEASDPLCAGLVAEMDGACGVLWGTALAAGVRARARIPDADSAQEATLAAARGAVAAYRRAGHPFDSSGALSAYLAAGRCEPVLEAVTAAAKEVVRPSG